MHRIEEENQHLSFQMEQIFENFLLFLQFFLLREAETVYAQEYFVVLFWE